jgi:hypothetical protein
MRVVWDCGGIVNLPRCPRSNGVAIASVLLMSHVGEFRLWAALSRGGAAQSNSPT